MIEKSKVKEILKFASKPVKENLLNSKIRRNAYYLDCIRLHKVKGKEVLLESYHGVNFTGNAYALFRKLIESYPEYKCHIAIKDINDPMIKLLKEEYKRKNFSVVEYESKKYLKLLATCKYLVNDTSFMPYFIKREEQVYLNTWHGTPLKTLGLDIKEASINEHKNIQKNLFSADKLSMPNQFTAEKLIKSNDLDGVLNAEVSILGNARVDLTLNSVSSEVIDKYQLNNDKKIVLFAPTWKKSEEETTDEEILDLIEQTNIIQQTLGREYHVYLKSHYFIYKKLLNTSYEEHLIPNWVDTNEILAAVDLLITDYSSIFFDFLPLKRPIHFFMPDKMEYESERGLYLELNSLPGRISNNIEELVANLKIDTNNYLSCYQNNTDNFMKLYCANDNGISSARTLDFLFGKIKGEKIFKSNKKVIVFYGGGFYNNGITNSIINLSKHFDYNKYEFVLIENSKIFKDKIRNLKRLDSRVYVISKFSYTNRNIYDTLSQNFLYRQGYNSKFINKKYLKKYFALDYKRVFGNLDPDIMIDYGGYNKMFTALFAFSPAKTKVIFLHNDMYGEYNKMINGRYTHKWNLKVIFSLYDEFDKLVSVTDSVNKANKENLKNFITHPDEKMISISNIIDGDEVKFMAQAADDKANHVRLYKKNQLQDFIIYDSEEKSDFNLELHCIQAPSKEDYNFVNVARLSPEKNHEVLIKAFKTIVEKEKKSKLYILGDGPLYNQLQQLIKKMNLE